MATPPLSTRSNGGPRPPPGPAPRGEAFRSNMNPYSVTAVPKRSPTILAAPRGTPPALDRTSKVSRTKGYTDQNGSGSTASAFPAPQACIPARNSARAILGGGTAALGASLGGGYKQQKLTSRNCTPLGPVTGSPVPTKASSNASRTGSKGGSQATGSPVPTKASSNASRTGSKGGSQATGANSARLGVGSKASCSASQLPKLDSQRDPSKSTRASMPCLPPPRTLTRTQSTRRAGARLYYTVQFGNNHGLVRSLLKKRSEWSPGIGDSGHSSGHLAMSGKQLLVSKLPPEPPLMNLLWTAWRNSTYMDALSERSNLCLTSNTTREIQFQPSPVPVSGLRAYNHFDGNSALCKKCELRESMVAYYHSIGRNPFDCVPLTYVLHQGIADPEFKRWQEAFESQKVAGKNLWLVKPGANSNQGRGIEVHDTVDGVKQYVDSRNIPWVLQKYIENPMLIDKRKFDVRTFGLITQEANGGPFSAYFFNDGYVRTTSTAYDTTSLDRSVHITNDQVQRVGADYGKFEEGNKLSLADLKSYLMNQSNQPASVFDDIIRQMRELVVDAVKAAIHKLNPRNIDHCFELFGFDFLIDDEYQVWLIEVNTDPSLETHSEHQRTLIPAMVEGVLALTVDKIFGTSPSFAASAATSCSTPGLSASPVLGRSTSGSGSSSTMPARLPSTAAMATALAAPRGSVTTSGANNNSNNNNNNINNKGAAAPAGTVQAPALRWERVFCSAPAPNPSVPEVPTGLACDASQCTGAGDPATPSSSSTRTPASTTTTTTSSKDHPSLRANSTKLPSSREGEYRCA